MNTADLQAALEKNKPVVLGGGLAAVVGVALYRKRKAGGSGQAGADLSAGSQTAATSGGAAYDSSASDLYGAIQPQLESIGQQLSALQAGPGIIPAPAPPAPRILPDPLRWTPGQPKQIRAGVIPQAAPRQPGPWYGVAPAPKLVPNRVPGQKTLR